MSLSIVILAAGKGSRMKSRRPKVIHSLAGRPMLQHVVDTSRKLDPDQIIVVVGHEADQVRQAMSGQPLSFVEQAEQLGTGHAVMQCNTTLRPGNDILVLYGDVPMIRLETLRRLVQQGLQENAVALLSFLAKNPTGYGRIIRDHNQQVIAIVEEKDATDEQRKITESNSGILYIKGNEYRALLSKLDSSNAQAEYYLTDVVKHAVHAGHKVSSVVCEDESELLGVNNQNQLAQIENLYRQQHATALMEAGVKLSDPARIDVRGELITGMDVEIDVNCIFEGRVELGDDVVVQSNCVLKDCVIGAGTIIQPMTVIDQSEIGRKNDIGPFARIRPETRTLEKAKIGNFVEVKKSQIGTGSKVNHLTYIGDTEMGARVNVGAGTITCNYDGAYKHKTIIEDDVFIGSDTQLVAPVRVSESTTIGAGSTITKDTPEGQLTFSRAKQVTISGWIRPSKNKQG